MKITTIKSQVSRFYRGVLKKKTPFLSLTVLQLLILLMVISAGVVAVVIAQNQSPPANTQDITDKLPTWAQYSPSSGNKVGEANQQGDEASNNTNNNVEQPQQPANNNPSLTAHTDQWGCTYYKGFRGTKQDIELFKTLNDTYLNCVGAKKKSYCVNQYTTAHKEYTVAETRANQEYSNIKNGTYMVRDKNLILSAPLGTYRKAMSTSYNQSIDYAYSLHKAIYYPAYTKYSNTIETLNATPNNCGIKHPMSTAPNYKLDYIY